MPNNRYRLMLVLCVVLLSTAGFLWRSRQNHAMAPPREAPGTRRAPPSPLPEQSVPPGPVREEPPAGVAKVDAATPVGKPDRRPSWIEEETRISNQDRQRERVLARYGYMLTRMDVAPDLMAKFKDQLVAHDAAKAGRRFRLDPEGRRTMREFQDRLNQETKDLLGEENYRKMQVLIGEGLYRDRIQDSLNGKMIDAGSPLTPDQTDALAKVYWDVLGAKNGIGRSPDGAKDINLKTCLKPSDEALLNRAALVLTPGQLEVFRRRLVDENMMLAVGEAAGRPRDARK